LPSFCWQLIESQGGAETSKREWVSFPVLKSVTALGKYVLTDLKKHMPSEVLNSATTQPARLEHDETHASKELTT
jgi:hypothetical protein